MPSLASIPVPGEDFLIRQLGEETIFLSADGSTIHTLDAVGSFVWGRIDGRISVQDIVTALCEEYDVPAETAAQDVARFLDELCEQGLARIIEG